MYYKLEEFTKDFDFSQLMDDVEYDYLTKDGLDRNTGYGIRTFNTDVTHIYVPVSPPSSQVSKEEEIVDYLKHLNPLGPTGLIYGCEYHLWRENKYLGVATWTQDENVGDSFQGKAVSLDGLISEVYIADKWELIK